MTETTTHTHTTPSTTSGTDKPARHFAELDPETGEPTSDKALCGYVFKALHVEHNGSVCQECLDELKRRGQP